MTIIPDDARFCWRPAWLNRYESLWSLLRKFAFFNGATAKNLQDAFGVGQHSPYSWTSRKRTDLRCYGGLDPLLLLRVFGVDRERLDESTVIPFVSECEHDLLTSHYLRFCHSCLKAGFHSSLHQILLLRDCPVHSEPLTDECQRCKTGVDYTLRWAPIANDIGCPDCVGRPEQDTEIRRRFTAVSNKREGKLLAASSFLLRRRELQIPEGATGTEWIAARRSTNARERRISSLARYWRQVVNGGATTVNAPANESYASFQYCPSQSANPRNVNSPSLRRESYHHDLDAEFIGILKSIRRQLQKQWLGPHRRCLFSLASYERRSMTSQHGKPCPYANILILWRLYWEELEGLFQLVRPYRKRINDGRERPIDWHPMPSYLPRNLVRRVFAIECLGVLEECYVLVRTMRRFNRHTFYPGFLPTPGRCMPYWIIERADKNFFRLHVWKTRPPRKSWNQFKFPEVSRPTHTRECDGSRAFPKPEWPNLLSGALRAG